MNYLRKSRMCKFANIFPVATAGPPSWFVLSVSAGYYKFHLPTYTVILMTDMLISY